METERLFYRLGKIILVLLVIVIIILKITDMGILDKLPECSFYSMTGIMCPGCGGTRALRFLLKGDVVRSFLYHPFVLYCLCAFIVFMIYEFIKIHFKKLEKIFPVEIVCCVGVGVLLLQWIVKVVLQFVL